MTAALLVMMVALAAAQEPTLTPVEETRAWQARRNESLSDNSGWLALAGLFQHPVWQVVVWWLSRRRPSPPKRSRRVDVDAPAKRPRKLEPAVDEVRPKYTRIPVGQSCKLCDSKHHGKGQPSLRWFNHEEIRVEVRTNTHARQPLVPGVEGWFPVVHELARLDCSAGGWHLVYASTKAHGGLARSRTQSRSANAALGCDVGRDFAHPSMLWAL